MTELTLEDVRLINILATTDSMVLQESISETIKERLGCLGPVLREYYRENTMGIKTGITRKFEAAGISEDCGKAAIACARRLGIDIS
jgi:hypothetical protein